MSCLAETLCVSSEYGNFNPDMEDLEEHEFRRLAINEIERYRRIDEWISSWNNIYSVTGMRCLRRLMDNKVIPSRVADFLRYCRPGNADALRIEGFSCLIDLDMLQSPRILRYLFFSYSVESSPYVRAQLWQILGRGLGRLAIGDSKGRNATEVTDGFVVEREMDTEARVAELSRTTTINGAVSALETELKGSEAFGQGLRDALL